MKRSFSTLILASLLAVVYFLGNPWIYILAFTAFCGIASWEWTRMLKKSSISTSSGLILAFGIIYPLLLGISLISPSTSLWSRFSYYICMLGPAFMAIASFLWELRRPVEAKETLLNISGTLLAFIYPVWMFSFSLYLLFPSIGGTTWRDGEPEGLMVFLWVFLVTKVMDTGAYLSGSLLGRHKMIPHISPNKSWEGFFGACLFTMLVGYGLAYLFGRGEPSITSVWVIIAIVGFSLVLGLISVIGDLAGSVIKRALGVKDSSNLLPGIGGIFDLVDSPSFTFPVACMVFWLAK